MKKRKKGKKGCFKFILSNVFNYVIENFPIFIIHLLSANHISVSVHYCSTNCDIRIEYFRYLRTVLSQEI